jgi:methyltransferase
MGAILAERVLELAINRRNARLLRERGALWLAHDGFALILASQMLLFTLTSAEVAWAPWSGERGLWTWALVGLLVAAQALRYWCIATLGWRWSIRVVTVPGTPRIVGGPYRLFPHPNYVVVMVEAVLLPLAFGAWGTALVVAPLQLAALWRRIRLEERALGAAEPAAPGRPSA